MHTYTPKTFTFPALAGISQKQIDVHLGLYQGYVKHVNVIREKIAMLAEDKEANTYLIAELRRRFAFEFNGMRLHEYYFEQFEGGPHTLESDGALAQALAAKYGSLEATIAHLTEVALSRGIGWTILYHDPVADQPHITWVSDHELGVLAGLPVILAIDMWEHAFMVDYVPAEKKAYLEAVFKNLNWRLAERRCAQIHWY